MDGCLDGVDTPEENLGGKTDEAKGKPKQFKGSLSKSRVTYILKNLASYPPYKKSSEKDRCHHFELRTSDEDDTRCPSGRVVAHRASTPQVRGSILGLGGAPHSLRNSALRQCEDYSTQRICSSTREVFSGTGLEPKNGQHRPRFRNHGHSAISATGCWGGHNFELWSSDESDTWTDSPLLKLPQQATMKTLSLNRSIVHHPLNTPWSLGAPVMRIMMELIRDHLRKYVISEGGGKTPRRFSRVSGGLSLHSHGAEVIPSYTCSFCRDSARKWDPAVGFPTAIDCQIEGPHNILGVQAFQTIKKRHRSIVLSFSQDSVTVAHLKTYNVHRAIGAQRARDQIGRDQQNCDVPPLGRTSLEVSA
ncbi:hypothetical protein TNCV_164431 [Trichonephila clavipes]|nr:hypothetical protein TNCV_164431 [Trichonephila clavipes]